MAAIIFAAGDKRFMGRNTRYMIHQPLGGMQGKASDIQTSLEEMMNLKTITSEILSSDSKGKISVEQIFRNDTKRLFFKCG